MTPNPIDPVIEEIRERRRRISQRFDNDPVRLVAYYMELQKQYQDRLVGSATISPVAEQSAQADRKQPGELSLP